MGIPVISGMKTEDKGAEREKRRRRRGGEGEARD